MKKILNPANGMLMPYLSPACRAIIVEQQNVICFSEINGTRPGFRSNDFGGEEEELEF